MLDVPQRIKKLGGLKMYIPEFWCGVIATVLSIIGCSLISDAVSRLRDRKRNKDETTEKADS